MKPTTVVALMTIWALFGSPSVAQTATPTVLHVNATTGDDADPGTQYLPFQTLNKALEVAYQTRFPNGPGVGPFGVVEIKVHRSDTPIAPAGNAGHELVGWQTPAEMAAGVTHSPFPLRMINGVDVVGVSRSGQRPVISISEAAGPYDQVGDWEPGLPKTYVWMASNMDLRGFHLSGEEYELNRADHRLSAVRARAVVNAVVDDCEVINFHDGVFFEAGVAAESGGYVQELVTGAVRNCVMADFFPVDANPLDAQDKGHAAIWLIGPGVQDVDVESVVISEAHDAIEIEGVEEQHGGQSYSTDATLDVSDCQIVDVENGVEVVGRGELSYSCVDTQFLNCSNIVPLGISPAEASVAAIAVRSMDNVMGVVRDCTFQDNAYSVLWQLSPSSMSLLDMGTICDPGGNQFLPFNFPINNADDYSRVHVFQGAAAGGNSEILTWGNTWIPDMQLADSVGAISFQGAAIGPLNVDGSGEPPGPFHGEVDGSTGLPYDRNYSIRVSAGTLSFGATCP